MVYLLYKGYEGILLFCIQTPYCTMTSTNTSSITCVTITSIRLLLLIIQTLPYLTDPNLWGILVYSLLWVMQDLYHEPNQNHGCSDYDYSRSRAGLPCCLALAAPRLPWHGPDASGRFRAWGLGFGFGFGLRVQGLGLRV